MLSNTSTSTHSIYHVLRHSTTYTLVILAIYYWGAPLSILHVTTISTTTYRYQYCVLLTRCIYTILCYQATVTTTSDDYSTSYTHYASYLHIYIGTRYALYLTPHHLSYTTLHMYTCHVRGLLITTGTYMLLQAYRLQEYISSPTPLGTSTIHYYVVLRTREHTITIYTLLLLMGYLLILPLPTQYLQLYTPTNSTSDGEYCIRASHTQLDYDVFYALHSQQDMGITSSTLDGQDRVSHLLVHTRYYWCPIVVRTQDIMCLLQS